MDTPYRATDSLDESLSGLALVAMRHAGADGFVYFRCSESGRLVRSQQCGVFIGEDTLSGAGSRRTVSFPLRLHGVVNGILAFAFPGREEFNALPRLKRLVSTIEKVWAAHSISNTYREILERIIALEAELIESKIVDRIQGVLSSGSDDEAAVDAIVRHVDSVLRPTATHRTLGQILEELQKDAEERDWARQAKSILQHIHGMSEEEAHSYLRKSSRQSRRPFVEVARQIVEKKA